MLDAEGMASGAGSLTSNINLGALKAAFFVKTFEGDKGYIELYKDDIAGAGRKMQVRFKDGETIIGYAISYSANRIGFFLVPADKKSNNERIFVLSSPKTKVAYM